MNLNNAFRNVTRVGGKAVRKANGFCGSPIGMAAISLGGAFLGYLAQKEAAKANNAALELYTRQALADVTSTPEIITFEEAKERGLIKEDPEEKEKKDESTEETLQEKLRNQLKK